MDSNEIFKILQVTKNSSAEDIKKAFRKLIFLYHPDSTFYKENDHLNANQIIEAYKKAITLVSEKNIITRQKFNDKFKVFFKIDLFKINSMTDFYSYIFKLLENIRYLLYSRDFILFTKELLNYLFDLIDNFENDNQKEEIVSILFVFNTLVESRIDSLGTISGEEYIIEFLRKDLINYFKNIFSQKDYLSFRYMINSNYESLLNDVVLAHKKTNEENYKKEINSIFFLIGLFGDETFYDKMWKLQ